MAFFCYRPSCNIQLVFTHRMPLVPLSFWGAGKTIFEAQERSSPFKTFIAYWNITFLDKDQRAFLKCNFPQYATKPTYLGRCLTEGGRSGQSPKRLINEFTKSLWALYQVNQVRLTPWELLSPSVIPLRLCAEDLLYFEFIFWFVLQ